MAYQDFFKGKKITLVGLGLLGRGVQDARFLAEMGADLIVTDLKTEEELQPSLDALKEFKNIHYTLGHHELDDFKNRDLIINGPAVPKDSPYIAEARAAGTPVTMSTALFAQFARDMGTTVVGVTGTRGKSTTTYLLEAIARAAGRGTILGGNIKGVSTLAFLPHINAETLAILELDSWQLQGFHDEHLSPQVAVFTTFYPDHLNYYHDDLDTYLSDKANIFLYQHAEDTLVLGAQCATLVEEKYQGRIPSTVVVTSGADVPPDWTLQLPGEHNRDNVACAIAAARALGLSDEAIRAACEAFQGVPGRLQPVGEIDGVKIYNDNSATTPEATIAGLRAVGDVEKRRVVLIMGGDEKNLDMSRLMEEILLRCKGVVLFKERGTDRIRDEVMAMNDKGLQVFEEEGLEACVGRALAIARPGDTLLYSPAFSSFGSYFKNEYDRGDQFMKLIQPLL